MACQAFPPTPLLETSRNTGEGTVRLFSCTCAWNFDYEYSGPIVPYAEMIFYFLKSDILETQTPGSWSPWSVWKRGCAIYLWSESESVVFKPGRTVHDIYG
jgi:hypothetical protein